MSPLKKPVRIAMRKDSKLVRYLRQANACAESIRWVQRNGIKTMHEAYTRTSQLGWAMWVVRRLGSVDKMAYAGLCYAQIILKWNAYLRYMRQRGIGEHTAEGRDAARYYEGFLVPAYQWLLEGDSLKQFGEPTRALNYMGYREVFYQTSLGTLSRLFRRIAEFHLADYDTTDEYLVGGGSVHLLRTYLPRAGADLDKLRRRNDKL